VGTKAIIKEENESRKEVLAANWGLVTFLSVAIFLKIYN